MGKEATPTLHVRENGRIPKRRQFRHHGLGCYSAAEPFGGTFDLRPVGQQIFVIRQRDLAGCGCVRFSGFWHLAKRTGDGAVGDDLVAGQIRQVAECTDGGMILEQHFV
jgi:hypothetical protein